MEKHFLDCKFADVKTSDFSDKFFMFEGYASTFGNEDMGGDIVMRGAFLDTIQELNERAVEIRGTQLKKLMPVLWQHNWNEPIGSYVEMREDAKGLYVKGLLPKSDDFVRGRVIPQMEAGSISDMSIGYIVEKESYKGNVRNIERAQLFETSLVTIPMNRDANVTGFKSADIKVLDVADRSIKWDAESKCDDESAFLLIKRTDAGADLRLRVADMIEGKLMAVPDAVFRAAHDVVFGKALDGVSDAHGAQVKQSITDLYIKMGLESPFKDNGAFRVDEIKLFSERELETMLKGGVCFSQKQAKAFISLLNDESQRDADKKSQRDAELKDNLNKLLQTL